MTLSSHVVCSVGYLHYTRFPISKAVLFPRQIFGEKSTLKVTFIKMHNIYIATSIWPKAALLGKAKLTKKSMCVKWHQKGPSSNSYVYNKREPWTASPVNEIPRNCISSLWKMLFYTVTRYSISKIKLKVYCTHLTYLGLRYDTII